MIDVDIKAAYAKCIENVQGEISEDGQFFTIWLRYYAFLPGSIKRKSTDLLTIISTSNNIFMSRGDVQDIPATQFPKDIKIPGTTIFIKEGEIKDEVVHVTHCVLNNGS